MPETASEKTKITMIQGKDGQTRRIRIGDTEIAVLVCGPIVGIGQMNFGLTIADVEVAYERADDAA